MRHHPENLRGTTAGRRNAGAQSNLADTERLNPEWRPWLKLLRLTLPALEEPAWDEIALRLSPDREAAAPLLHCAKLSLPVRLAHAHVRALLDAAADAHHPGGASLAALRDGDFDALHMLNAALRLDHDGIATIATSRGADPLALQVVAQLAAMPVLHACHRRLSGTPTRGWVRGYCPCCAAWPSLAELRGLDRERHLRCARCGADWHAPLLLCSYCGESDHEWLGSLVPEGEEQTRRVETCRRCQGYVKALATLTAIPAAALPVEDLNTVELDLAAVERGYTRPERPGFDLSVDIVRPSSRADAGGRR